jgi:hypothetical protein
MKKARHTRTAMRLAKKRKILAAKGKEPHQDVRGFKRNKALATAIRVIMIGTDKVLQQLTRRLRELADRCVRAEREEEFREIANEYGETLAKLEAVAKLALRTFQAEMARWEA